MEGNTLKEYAGFLTAEGRMSKQETTDRGELFSVIKDFTRKEIRVIIPFLTLVQMKNSRKPFVYGQCGCFKFRNDMYYISSVVLVFVFFIMVLMDDFVVNS